MTRGVPGRGGVMRPFVLTALIAVELLMSFSFLGYFHIEPISVTTAYIPVLLAGALVGPGGSTAVGAAFGLASLWKASASYVMPADQLFSPLLSGAPFGSLMLSVGSRALFGLTVGLLYAAVRRTRHPTLGVAAVSFFGQRLHALLVYSAMALFFPEAGYGPADALTDLFDPMDIVSGLAIAGLVLLPWRLSRSRGWVRFRQRLELARSLSEGERYHRLSLAVAVAVTLMSALAVTFYFVHRIGYVLEVNDITLTDTGYADVLHLQVQFLLGIISLMVLVILFLILNRRYTAYTAIEGKLDSLTGLMTRKAFFTACGKALEARGDAPCYFIMADLDYFKEINDAHGHPEGDRALKEVARSLKEAFPVDTIIGRMGGDEFALLVCVDMSRAEMEVALRHFLDHVRRTAWEGRQLTCSVGALRAETPRPPEELYLAADKLLYAAKERGRSQYVIGADAPAPSRAAAD